LSSSARKQTTVGEMTNLITTDAQVFDACFFYFVGMISAPIQIFIAAYMLWKYLGPATLVGLASMIIFLPFNGVFAKKSKKLRKEKAKFQDSRIKMMNELLNGIKVSLALCIA